METSEVVLLKVDCPENKGKQAIYINCIRNNEGRYIPTGSAGCGETTDSCQNCIKKAMEFVFHGHYETRSIKIDRTWGTEIVPLPEKAT